MVMQWSPLAFLTHSPGLVVLLLASCGAVLAATGELESSSPPLLPREQYSAHHLAYLNFNITTNGTRNEIEGLITALDTEYLRVMLRTDPRYKDTSKPNHFSPDEAKLLECLGGTNDKNNLVNNVVLAWAHGVRSKRWETEWEEGHPNPFAQNFEQENGVTMAQWRQRALPRVLFLGNDDDTAECSPEVQLRTFQMQYDDLNKGRKWTKYGFLGQIMVDGMMMAAAQFPSVEHRLQKECFVDWKSEECAKATEELKDRHLMMRKFVVCQRQPLRRDDMVDGVVETLLKESSDTRDRVDAEISSELEEVFEQGWSECEGLERRLLQASNWFFAGKGRPSVDDPMNVRVEGEIAAEAAERAAAGLQTLFDKWNQTLIDLQNGNEVAANQTLAAIHEAMEEAQQKQVDAKEPMQRAHLLSGMVAYLAQRLR